MGNNIYNNESEHSRIIEDLKELPKIKAPENFEFNLMTKIQNKNFGDLPKERTAFNVYKFLAPSAVVVTALILFFLFLPQNQQQIDNPLMSEPVVIADNVESPPLAKNNQKEIANKQSPKSVENKQQPNYLNEYPSSNLDALINPNDVVVKSPGKYPINRSRTVALDDYISGSSTNRSGMQRGNVVKSGEEGADFDGFFVRQEPDPQTIEKYRAMMDSVKKAQIKADSIRKAQK